MPPEEAPELQRLANLFREIDPEVLYRLMPPAGGVITMMFTDIVDSTRVKKAIGDDPYFKALELHYALARRCLAKHGGYEFKTIGDSFFAGFRSPQEAVNCAVEIQRQHTESPIPVGEELLNARIGMHTGTPKPYRDEVSGRIDLSGTDVDKAARVESLARGGQVLISEETSTLAKPAAAHDWGRWELKGLGLQRLFEVLWPGRTPQPPSGHVWLEPVRFLTSFVGRQDEVAKIIEAVKQYRLVTIIGIGGIGKTRLADEVARRVSDLFDHGVFFIELAYAQDSEAAVASELVARLKVNAAGFRDDSEALLADRYSIAHLLAAEPLTFLHELALHLPAQRHGPAKAERAEAQVVENQVAKTNRGAGVAIHQRRLLAYDSYKSSKIAQARANLASLFLWAAQMPVLYHTAPLSNDRLAEPAR